MILRTQLKSVLSTVVTCLVLFTGQLSAQNGILREGTPVRLKLNRTISSATEHQGERVDFEVLDDVKASGIVIIPHGSIALATVTEAVPKGRMGKGGKLNVNIDFVRLLNGDRLTLRGVQESKGGGHTGAMAGAMVGTAVVFWPAAPLFLLMHGKDITVPQGHEITAYTNSDYNPAEASVAQGSQYNTSTTSSVLTNSDVLKLAQAGFSEQFLITKIQRTRSNYQLDAGSMTKLKEAGVSEAVMTAMMEATH